MTEQSKINCGSQPIMQAMSCRILMLNNDRPIGIGTLVDMML